MDLSLFTGNICHNNSNNIHMQNIRGRLFIAQNYELVTEIPAPFILF